LQWGGDIINLNIIPKNSSIDSKNKHNNKEKWSLFARKLTKSIFMKNYLKDKYNNKCPWCGYNLNDNLVIHHIDYDHECFYNNYIKISHPTNKRPNRTYKAPDCENCYKTTNNKFNECIIRIAPVHKFCNLQIEEKYKEMQSEFCKE